MLGRGLYGAPDPRKSLQYCRSANKFMFICRYNLASPAQHAGPSTQHRNSIFDEFCVYDERRVVVLAHRRRGLAFVARHYVVCVLSSFSIAIHVIINRQSCEMRARHRKRGHRLDRRR